MLEENGVKNHHRGQHPLHCRACPRNSLGGGPLCFSSLLDPATKESVKVFLTLFVFLPFVFFSPLQGNIWVQCIPPDTDPENTSFCMQSLPHLPWTTKRSTYCTFYLLLTKTEGGLISEPGFRRVLITSVLQQLLQTGMFQFLKLQKRYYQIRGILRARALYDSKSPVFAALSPFSTHTSLFKAKNLFCSSHPKGKRNGRQICYELAN